MTLPTTPRRFPSRRRLPESATDEQQGERDPNRWRAAALPVNEERQKQQIAHAGCRIERTDHGQNAEAAAAMASSRLFRGHAGDARGRGQRHQRDRHHDTKHRHYAEHRSPGDELKQHRDKRRQDGLSEVSRKIVNSKRPARSLPITVGDEHRAAWMLNARSNTGDDEADAQTRKTERQRHDHKARRSEHHRQDQRCTRRRTPKGTVRRNLEASHRAVIESANDGERGVGKTELRLPQGQESIKSVCVAVMKRVGETRTDKAAPLQRPCASLVYCRRVFRIFRAHRPLGLISPPTVYM